MATKTNNLNKQKSASPKANRYGGRKSANLLVENKTVLNCDASQPGESSPSGEVMSKMEPSGSAEKDATGVVSTASIADSGLQDNASQEPQAPVVVPKASSLDIGAVIAEIKKDGGKSGLRKAYPPRTEQSHVPCKNEEGKTIRWVPVADLIPHPKNIDIYGTPEAPELFESIKEHGVLTPLLVKGKNIISGHLRYAGSIATGKTHVPVCDVQCGDGDAEIAMLIHCNRQRVKTNEQIAREAYDLMKIKQNEAQTRQAAARRPKKSNLVPVISSAQKGDARDKVAEELKIGGSKVDECVSVVGKLIQLDSAGKKAAADEIRKHLKKSIHAAADHVKAIEVLGSGGAPAAEISEPEVMKEPAAGDIISDLQVSLCKGMAKWPAGKIDAFKSAVLQFRQDWETRQQADQKDAS